MHGINSIVLGLAATLAAPASAYIRMTCPNNVVEERADPIVNPGKVSGHVHKIAGGSGFGLNMTYDQARASKCSSCQIKPDLSNYWTPLLYYHAQNGSFIPVPVAGDSAAAENGGMVVYYQQRGGPNNDKLKAFPPGFRMLAGDPFKRNYTGDFAADAVSWACLYGGGETKNIPNKKCENGLRAQIYFPSCWDGVNLDSPDHKSHMAYPESGSYDNGPCPSSHPVHLVSIFFEILYNIAQFDDGWYGDSHPWVLANGDTTGYGFHGDFVNGWDQDILQAIIDNCDVDSDQGSVEACQGHVQAAGKTMDLFTSDESNACKIPPTIDEPIHGVLPALPGCNPVTSGPDPATPVENCASSNATIQTATFFTDLTQEGSNSWKYLGCGTDSATSRTLADKQTTYSADAGTQMTVEYCQNFCQEYTYFGLENGNQCFCGNTLDSSKAPQAGILGNCNVPCVANATQYCGGSWALSLYQKCSGSDCTNADYSAAKRDLGADAVAQFERRAVDHMEVEARDALAEELDVHEREYLQKKDAAIRDHLRRHAKQKRHDW